MICHDCIEWQRSLVGLNGLLHSSISILYIVDHSDQMFLIPGHICFALWYYSGIIAWVKMSRYEIVIGEFAFLFWPLLISPLPLWTIEITHDSHITLPSVNNSLSTCSPWADNSQLLFHCPYRPHFPPALKCIIFLWPTLINHVIHPSSALQFLFAERFYILSKPPIHLLAAPFLWR